MLIYLQNPNVTFFGGTSYWKKKFKRTIKEDARAYLILAPMSPVMMAYDVMDTEGVDTPQEFLIKGLGSKPIGVNGKINPKVLDKVIASAVNYGIKVIPKPLSFFNGGHITTIWSGKLEIVLKETSTTEEKLSVLIHELAHLFLGHTGHKEISLKNTDKKIKLLDRTDLTKTGKELEAETVSFLLCKKLGLETRAAEYMAAYIKSENDLINFSYETVIKVADKIESKFFEGRMLNVTPKQISIF